jgi:hypothetical protein
LDCKDGDKIGTISARSGVFMAVKRSRKTSRKVSAAYQQAMVAEGAPVALDLLGFGSAIGDLIRGKKAKPAAKKKKKLRAKTKAKTSRAKKKSPARKSRRRK